MNISSAILPQELLVRAFEEFDLVTKVHNS